MSTKSNVSADFLKFYGTEAQAIEDAKKAENMMSSAPCDVGYKGQCIPLEAKADKGKDTKQEDGSTRPGNSYIMIKWGFTGDPAFQGKSFNLYFSFYDSEKASKGDRFTWFLNQMENWGLPRDIRENHTHPGELLDWLLSSEQVFDCECVASEYSRDKKEMKVTPSVHPVDTSSSMAPPVANSAPVSKAPDFPQPGDDVTFLGNTWKVVSRDGDSLAITRDSEDGTLSRNVRVDQLSGK